MTTSTKPTIEQCLDCKVENCNGECPKPSMPKLEIPNLTKQWCKYGVTPRRQQILMLLMQGYTQVEIAKILGLHLNTVKNHVNEAHRGLNCRTSVAAVIKCLKLGIFKLEEIEVK